MNKKLYAILSFIFPIIIFIVFFSIYNLISTNKIFYSDNLAQYLPTYRYLYNVMHNTATFPYTFSKGLGGTMYGAFFYGLSSPFNLFLYFFENVKLFMLISILLKIGLSGLTCFLLLKSKGHKDINSFIFSIAYSLSGYMCMYFIHVMWLDAVWLLPVIIIGIDRIISKRKDILYIVSLFVALLSNYYIGYMLVLLSIIYYLSTIYINYTGKHFFKENKKNIFHFIFITLLIGCLIMFILIPVFMESLNFNRFFKPKNIINPVFLDILSGSYIGYNNIDNLLNDNAILIYSGTLIFVLNVLYFFSSKISKKKKRTMAVIYLLMLLPVIIKPLDYIWHLFTYTNDFSYRYSFIFILITIMNASEIFELDEIYNKRIIYIIIIYLVFSASMIYTIINKPMHYNLGLFNIIFTILFLLANVYLLKKKKYIICQCLLIFELLINFSFACEGMQQIGSQLYKTYERNVIDFSKYSSEKYRIETTDFYTGNDGLYANYNGVNSFISSQNSNNINFSRSLRGINKDSNMYTYIYYNIFYDSLINLKYICDYNENIFYDVVKQYNEYGSTYYIQKNPYALGFGYTVSNDILDFDIRNNKDINFYNSLFSAIDGTNNEYLMKLQVEKNNSNTFIIKKNNQYSQIYINTSLMPNNINWDYFVVNDNYLVYFDQNNKDIKLIFDEDIEYIEAYTIDIDKIKEFINNREQLVLDENKGNYLSGTITLSKDSIFMLTIPYEKGWTIYVDNKKINYYKLLDSFIGIDLSKGNHKIEMYYGIPGIKIGIVISLISLVTIIIYEIRKRDSLCN